MGVIIPVMFGDKPSGYNKDLDDIEIEENTETDRENIARSLQCLDQIRALVAAGRITDFIFVGRDNTTRLFLTELMLNPPVKTDLFAYSGVLSTLQLELNESAQEAPVLLSNGKILDPWTQFDIDEEDFDD